jgi:hypothetical protein
MDAQPISIPDSDDRLNVMMFSNNPAEMSVYMNNLSNFKGAKFNPHFHFSLRYRYLRMLAMKPAYILIDDFFSREQIRKFIRKVRRNIKTQEIPVAILKSRNTQFYVDDVQDYILKDGFTPERLFHSVRNSRNIRKAQIILYKTYKKSKKQYLSIIKSLRRLF